MIEAQFAGLVGRRKAARVGPRWFGLVFVLASPALLFAQTEFSWSAGAGVSHSDNINREESGEISENTINVDGAIEWRRRSNRVDAQVDASVSVREFTNNTFSTEVRGNLVADLYVQVIGESLSWQVQDTFGQLRIDNFAPDTPANRENINLFRTGPVLSQRLGSRTTLMAQAYYETSYFEVSTEDGDTVGGSIALERRLGRRALGSINALGRRVEFDEQQLFSSFDAQELYLALDVDGARTRVRVDAGYSAIRGADQTDDGALFRLRVDRRVARLGTIAFNARSELTTTTDAFRYEQTVSRPGLVTRSREATADPFKLDSVELSYGLDGRRFQAEFLLQFEREQFQRNQLEDRDRSVARFTVGGQVGPMWSAEVGVDYADESLRNAARDFNDVLVQASVSRRFSNNVNARLGVAHLDRSATDRALQFKELVIELAVTYQNQRSRRREGGAARR